MLYALCNKVFEIKIKRIRNYSSRSRGFLPKHTKTIEFIFIPNCLIFLFEFYVNTIDGNLCEFSFVHFSKKRDILYINKYISLQVILIANEKLLCLLMAFNILQYSNKLVVCQINFIYFTPSNNSFFRFICKLLIPWLCAFLYTIICI